MNANLISRIIIFILLYSTGGVAAQDYSDQHKHVVHKNRLYNPTFFKKIGKEYFIVDCYNNRIIYTEKIATPIGQWKTMDDEGLSWPHSIAYNGKFYVVDDTEAHRVLVYRRDGNTFHRTQIISDVGVRPHRVIYDSVSEAFYVLGSVSQTITKLKEKNGVLMVVYTKHLPFLKNAYVRSMRIIDGKMFFVSGPGYISVVEYNDNSYEVVKKYVVPDRYRGMNDIVKNNNAFLITAFKKNILKCKSLDNFSSCKQLYNHFGLKGVPYYFSKAESKLFVTEIGSGNRVYLLKNAENNSLRPIQVAPHLKDPK